MTLNIWVKTIALAEGRYDSSYDATVTGWGQTTSGSSNVLRKATVRIDNPGTCSFNGVTSIPVGSMFCAGAGDVLGTLVGICLGDSGGSLTMVNGAGERQLVGVVNQSVANFCLGGYQFARVADFVPWIKQVAFGQSLLSCQGSSSSGAVLSNWQQTTSDVI